MRKLVVGLLVALPVWAQADIEAQLGVASKEVFRGQGLSDDQISLKAGIDGEWHGLYVGSELSTINVDADFNARADVYGGYQFGIGGVAIGFGALYHRYEELTPVNQRFEPADGTHFVEYAASVAYGPSTLTYYQEQNNQFNYAELRNFMPLGNTMAIEFSLGQYRNEAKESAADVALGVIANLRGETEMILRVSHAQEMNDDVPAETNFTLGFHKRFGF